MKRLLFALVLLLPLEAQAQFTCRPTAEVSPFGGNNLHCTQDFHSGGPVTQAGGFAQGLINGLSLPYTLTPTRSSRADECTIYIERIRGDIAAEQAALTARSIAELHEAGLDHLIENNIRIGQNLYQTRIELEWKKCLD